MSKYRIRPFIIANLFGIQVERYTFPSLIVRQFFPHFQLRKKWVWQRDEDGHSLTFTSYEKAERYVLDRLEFYTYDDCFLCEERRDNLHEFRA